MDTWYSTFKFKIFLSFKIIVIWADNWTNDLCRCFFFLVWFEYFSKYDWFLWIWVDYRFGVIWGSGHAAYIPYALPDPCLHDAVVVYQVALAPFVKSLGLHIVETGKDVCHCVGDKESEYYSFTNIVCDARHTVCSIPSSADPVEIDSLRPLVRF